MFHSRYIFITLISNSQGGLIRKYESTMIRKYLQKTDRWNKINLKVRTPEATETKYKSIENMNNVY